MTVTEENEETDQSGDSDFLPGADAILTDVNKKAVRGGKKGKLISYKRRKGLGAADAKDIGDVQKTFLPEIAGGSGANSRTRNNKQPSRE